MSLSQQLDQEKDQCLHELSWNLGLSTGMPPMTTTALCEHVFQELIQQFYERGTVYFPNFGWLHFHPDENEVVFTPCKAMLQTLQKIRDSLDSETFSFAGIDMRFKRDQSRTSV